MSRWVSADAVAGHLRPGMTVFVAGATGEPRDILEALARHNERCDRLHFVTVPIPGLNAFDYASLHPTVRLTAFFATPQNQKSIATGRVDYIPLQNRAIYDFLEQDLA